MTLPTLSEMKFKAVVRTQAGEEMLILNPEAGEVLRLGSASVSYENPESPITHFQNDLNQWKPFN
jgi:hypothetical protein